VSGCADEQYAARPSMKPIDSSMADTSEKVQRSSFRRKEVNKRNLGYGNPCSPKSDIVEEVSGKDGRVHPGKQHRNCASVREQGK